MMFLFPMWDMLIPWWVKNNGFPIAKLVWEVFHVLFCATYGNHFRFFHSSFPPPGVGFLSRKNQWWTLNQNLVSGKKNHKEDLPKIEMTLSNANDVPTVQDHPGRFAGKQRWHGLLSFIVQYIYICNYIYAFVYSSTLCLYKHPVLFVFLKPSYISYSKNGEVFGPNGTVILAFWHLAWGGIGPKGSMVSDMAAFWKMWINLMRSSFVKPPRHSCRWIGGASTFR